MDYGFAIINENILLTVAANSLQLYYYHYSTFRAVSPSHRYSTRINESTKHGGFLCAHEQNDKTPAIKQFERATLIRAARVEKSSAS